MTRWYRGSVDLDGIDQPVTLGSTVFSIIGCVEIEVECEVDEGYTRDSNGDGCPPSEVQRDYTVTECDLSLMLGDDEIANVRDWAGIGDPLRAVLVPRLDKACEDCDCCEEIESADPPAGFRPVGPHR